MMKVGEIGVLQNLENDAWLNGSLAEIIGCLRPREAINHNGKHVLVCYLCKIFDDPHPMVYHGVGWRIAPHKIRRLTDPDAEQVTEREKELVK